MFISADINSDGFMDEDESVELIKTLSDGVRDNVIKTKLHEYLRLDVLYDFHLRVLFIMCGGLCGSPVGETVLDAEFPSRY